MSHYVRRERFESCPADEPGRYRPQRCPHQPRCTTLPAGFGRVRVAWTGPIRSRAQADREVTAWAGTGWAARRCESTPEVRAQVRAWEEENRQRST